MITQNQIDELRGSLKVVQQKGKLNVLAGVAGLSKARLKEIVDGTGAEMTLAEFSILDMLR